MDNCIGIISLDHNEGNFGGLCKNRPVYMLPFGGRYRIIDVAISNMVNHGIKTVAVYTGEKIRSTMDHLGNGKPWDLNRRFNGLFLFPPVPDGEFGSMKNDISQFYSTNQFFRQTKEEYIFLVHPNFLSKVDLSKVFKYFIKTEADITLVYKKEVDPWGELINCDKMNIDNVGNLLNMGLNLATEKEFNHFIGMGVMKKSVFLKIVMESIEKGDANSFKEAMILNRSSYKINTYEFKGNVQTIKNLKTYYDANLQLLEPEVSKEVFHEGGAIFTKSKDEPPTLYTESSNVQNSFIANGCIIEGDIENCIVFRGVTVGRGAIVKNSILMQKSEVMENAIVVNTILDKYTSVGSGIRLAGSSVMPYVVEKYQKIRKD